MGSEKRTTVLHTTDALQANKKRKSTTATTSSPLAIALLVDHDESMVTSSTNDNESTNDSTIVNQRQLKSKGTHQQINNKASGATTIAPFNNAVDILYNQIISKTKDDEAVLLARETQTEREKLISKNKQVIEKLKSSLSTGNRNDNDMSQNQSSSSLKLTLSSQQQDSGPGPIVDSLIITNRDNINKRLNTICKIINENQNVLLVAKGPNVQKLISIAEIVKQKIVSGEEIVLISNNKKQKKNKKMQDIVNNNNSNNNNKNSNSNNNNNSDVVAVGGDATAVNDNESKHFEEHKVQKFNYRNYVQFNKLETIQVEDDLTSKKAKYNNSNKNGNKNNSDKPVNDKITTTKESKSVRNAKLLKVLDSNSTKMKKIPVLYIFIQNIKEFGNGKSLLQSGRGGSSDYKNIKLINDNWTFQSNGKL